jgi:hypothetical protein
VFFFFFFGLFNCMNLCGWVGLGFDNIMCYIHSRNKHSSVRRLSWQILHHFFFFFVFFLCVCTTRTPQLAPKKEKKKKKSPAPWPPPPPPLRHSYVCRHDLIGKLHMMLLTSSSWASTVFGSPPLNNDFHHPHYFKPLLDQFSVIK